VIVATSAKKLQIGLMLRNGQNRPAGAGRLVRWTELSDMAKLAEEVGVDTLFVPDHLIFRNAPPIVVPEGESHGVWEAFTLLSAISQVTRRVTLGPFVACISFRNPALLAKMADTLDEVSGGRLILGLGAGWHKPEYDAFGYPFDHLASRFEEALAISLPLLREGRVDFQGDYYLARDCELVPRGPRPGGPPIWIGAKQPRMMRLVARHADAYNTVFRSTPAAVRELFDKLDAACGEVGRDPATIMHTAGGFLNLPEATPDDPPGLPDDAIDGSIEEIAAKLHAMHVEGGVEHMTLFLNPWSLKGIERFGRVIEELRKLEG
jgi:alkanesulfonate monooxygenase SsuD/methylene tetrahydromethanopterin reductase-like flavin-dependent oxidoreductase (luciferase family)